MKEKIKKYTKEIVTFIIIMTVLANAISFYKSSNLNKDALNEVNIILIDNSNYKYPNNKPILVHYWATWCPICKIEASNIQSISQSYEVLTIAVKSGSDEDIRAYMNENDIDFKVFNDENGFFAQKANIAVYPTTFIYDKNKKLVFSEVGYTSTFGLWLRMWWAGV